MTDLGVTIAIALIGWLSSLLMVAWSFGKKYGEIQADYSRLKNDLNNGLNSLRQQIRRQDYLLQSQITHLQEHEIRKGDYHPPTLRNLDD